MTVLLEVDDLYLSFGGVEVLSGTAFSIAPGELTALIGPNGAGKSSLLNCINGFYRPQRGRIAFDGHQLQREAPHRIAALGIARTFQHVEVLGKDSVLDNVLLGRHMHIRAGTWAGAVHFGRSAAQERRSRARALEIIEFLDLGDVQKLPVGGLPYGTQKLVEIGRALAMEPRLLLLDEPTSGMTPHEKQLVAAIIRRISSDMKVTQLLIEHDMRFVTDLCSRAVVLNFGGIIADGAPNAVLQEERVVEAYIGRSKSSSQVND